MTVRWWIFLAIGLLTRTRWRGRHLAVAAAIDAGTFVEGFRGKYVNACRAEDALSERLQAARHATGALRWHLSEAGAETEVVSVEELQRLGGYANRSQTGILEERVVLDVMGERVHEHVCASSPFRG